MEPPKGLESYCDYDLFSIDHWKKAALAIVAYALCYVSTTTIIDRWEGGRTGFILLLQVVYFTITFFYFTLGVMLYRFIGRQRLSLRNWQAALLLLSLIVVKSFFRVTLADGLYALCFILLFLQLRLSRIVTVVLESLGRRSMVMWMTHTFFAVYLFPDFIYGFRYPVLIFIVLVAELCIMERKNHLFKNFKLFK